MITISAPFHSRCQNPGPKIYSIPDFHSRSLLSIIHDNIFNQNHHSQFYYEPYELHWQPLHRTTSVWVYGELFMSQCFLEAHEQLQASPREPGCDLPRHIVGLMFWSDSTQLTSFGDAKLWPLYMYFGNKSKYTRGQPSSGLCMHVAYFQVIGTIVSLPENGTDCKCLTQLLDEFKDFATRHAGNKVPGELLFTHCHRELFHAQWEELLDDDFISTYEHGMVITCCDGMTRRLYPCIFTYSADYPEKYA